MSWEAQEVELDEIIHTSSRRGVELCLWGLCGGAFQLSIKGPVGVRGRVTLSSTDLRKAKAEAEQRVDAMDLAIYLSNEAYELWLEKSPGNQLA